MGSDREHCTGGIDRSDPHSDDFCVVCKRGPECGATMYPVAPIDNGCVCGKCITSAEYALPWGVEDQ